MNEKSNHKLIKVLIGQISVTREPHILESVWGSCIGLVMYDKDADICGMAHILLPDSTGRKVGSLPGKFADCAVPCLYNALLERGARKGKIKAKIAGGARMFKSGGENEAMNIGEHNVTAVKTALKKIGITLSATDVGGEYGRKVDFDLGKLDFRIENFSKKSYVI